PNALGAPKGFRGSLNGMIETRLKITQERALLIGLEKDGVSKWDLRDSLEELRELASSAGAKVVDTVTQKLPKPTAPYYIGRGKAESVKDSCQDQQVTSVILMTSFHPRRVATWRIYLRARSSIEHSTFLTSLRAVTSPANVACRFTGPSV